MTNTLLNNDEKLHKVVNSIVRASNQLTRLVDPVRAYEYTFAVFFWKYISDMWKEEFEGLDILNDEVSVRHRLASSRFFIPPESSFYEVRDKGVDRRLGSYINMALQKISFANSSKLDQLFIHLDFASEDEFQSTKAQGKLWSRFLGEFCEPGLDFGPSKIDVLNLGEAFKLLVSRMQKQSGKNFKEAYTPDYISRLIAKLAMPKPSDFIFDPVCGTGSLLIRTSEEIKGRDFRLFGKEIDRSFWSMARLNVLFHELDDTRLELGDSLVQPGYTNGNTLAKFDRIVANPPTQKAKREMVARATMALYGKASPNRWYDYTYGASGTLMFLDMAIMLSKPRSGRVVIVVPEGFLFRGRDEWGFRQKLVEENILEAVIGIPEGRTIGSPSSAILVIDRSREKGGENSRNTDVKFIDTKESYDRHIKSSNFDVEYAQEVFQIYQGIIGDGKSLSKVAANQIADNNFDFTVSRYVQPERFELRELIQREEKKVRYIEQQIEISQLKIDENMKKLETRQVKPSFNLRQ